MPVHPGSNDKGACGRLFAELAALAPIKNAPQERGVLARVWHYQAARFLATNSQLTRAQKVSMYFGRRLRKSM